MPALPSLWWGSTAAAPIVLAWRRPVWLIAVFFVGGVFWVSFRAGLLLDQQLPQELEGRDLELIGHVADIPQTTEYGFRFLFDVERARLADRSVRVPRRVLLSSSVENVVVRVGERWKFRARLSRPHGFQNPGGFDYEGYLFRNRIRARGYVRADLPPERFDDASIRYAIDRARQRLGERIAALVPNSTTAGMVVALANGDQRRIDPSQWPVLRATGTVHLVAISGLHISLIGGLAFFLGRHLWALPGVTVQWCAAPVAGAIAALLAATAYSALAGFVVPTQRALVMLAVAMGGILLRRRFAPSQLLGGALLLVLVYDPLSVMAPGFWLSFAAVAVILYVASGADDPPSWFHRWGYLQWAIALGMLPLTLALFQRVSLIAPIANLIAVPVFDLLAAPLTLAGIAALVTLPDVVAAALFLFTATLLSWLWTVLQFLAGLHFGEWVQHAPPAWALGCALVGVAVLLAPRGWPARWVGAAWLLPLFLARPPTPVPGELWFTLLDVGQGLSAVIRTQRHTLVYDTGPRLSETFDTGEVVVAPYLRAQGVAGVDALVISHADNDHRGGAESLLRAMTVGRVLSSAPALPFASEACIAGMRWNWDGIEFEILHPPTGERSRHNNSSCVLVARSRHGSVLLSGDIEKRAEQLLLARHRGRLAADILVAPHHGSKTSSHGDFILVVRPAYVLFPVGYRNPYRHPHPAVLQRYAGAGARLRDSASAGALEFRLDEQGIRGSAYRDVNRRYWFIR